MSSAAIAILLAFVAGARAGDRGLARRYFDEGIVQYKRGDLEPALSSLSKAITENSSLTPAYAWRAQVRYALGGGRYMSEDLKKALTIVPNDVESFLARAAAYTFVGDTRKALDDYEQVLRADPENAEAFLGRGRAYRAAGDDATAIKDWTEALRLDPMLVVARYNRALSYHEQNKVNYAVDDLARALRTNPKFPLPYALLGVIFAQRGDFNRAIQAYSKAIFLNPNYTYAYLGRAAAYMKKSSKDLAFKDYEEALRVAPDHFSPLYDRGEMKYRLGDRDGAMADFRLAIETVVDHTPSAVLMGNRLTSEALHDDALRMYTKGIQAVSMAPAKLRVSWLESALLRRANVYEILSQNDKALADLDELVAYSSSSVAGWTARGRLLFKMTRDTPALSALNRAVLLNPKHVPARIARGRLHAALGRNREALADFNAAVKYGPDVADAFSNRGLLYAFTLSDEEKALPDLLRAVGLAPKDPEAYFNLGDALLRRKDYRKAIESFDRALTLKGTASKILQRRAHAYFKQGDVTKAVSDLRSALEIDPRNGNLYSQLALMRIRSHDYVQAERDLGQAAEVGPEDFPFYFAQGMLHGVERRYGLAVNAFKKALSKDPGSAETLAFLCRAFRLGRDPREAVRACSKAIDIDPKLGPAYIDRGFAWIALREFSNAVTDLDEGHKLGARHAPAQLARSVAHATMRQYKESDEAYRIAIDLDPLVREPDLDFDGTPIGKPDYYTLMGNLEKLFDKDQGNPYVYLLRGNAIHNGGYFDRAIMEYTKAMEMDASIAASYLARGAALASQQSYEAAEQDYRRAVDLAPHNPQAHTRLLTLLAIRRRFEAGVGAAVEGSKLAPRWPEVYLRAGNLRYFLKDIRKAQENYTLALNLDGRYADAWNGLGLCMFSQRRYADAIEHFSRAIGFNDHNDRFYRNRAAAWMNLGQFSNAAVDYRNALAVNTDPDMVAEYQKLVQTAQAQVAPGADSGLPTRAGSALQRLPAARRVQ
ncbi:MAG: tetratricopeptide repeat protein [Elusimicrobia bacterium]|nr:tetratricopeptide repeat protein [Elusimicrobiota bacterium]